ncbi:hypothetical protein CAEBREN_24590 [Caenorhabditis brenneri]|uniref:Uncharacterized protein n=1 Tax=Caenorhabditis brenneri TaxID=135651 RepID=G0MHW5_CAEBE|nr:hypothetical protein CAEBREN_24590 [Caenorhabditis brenneri]
MLAGFSVPRFYFPILAGSTHGIFHDWGVSIPTQIVLGFGSLGAMIASIAALFVYRHQVIVGDDHWLKLRRRNLIVLLVFNYLVYVNMPMPLLFTSPPNQLLVKIKFLRNIACPAKNLLDPEVYVAQENTVFFIPYACVLIVYVGAECGLLSLHAAWILFFSTLRANFSRRTRMLQIQFLFALFLQIAIPTALCYCPIIYGLITIYLDHYWQFANDMCVFVFSTHGTISSICVILLYDCYRDYLFYRFYQLFRCCCGRREGSSLEHVSPARSENSANAINRSYIT